MTQNCPVCDKLRAEYADHGKTGNLGDIMTRAAVHDLNEHPRGPYRPAAGSHQQVRA